MEGSSISGFDPAPVALDMEREGTFNGGVEMTASPVLL